MNNLVKNGPKSGEGRVGLSR